MSKEKVKKPFYKRWWVWAIAIIIVIAAFSGMGEDSVDEANNNTDNGTKATSVEPKNESNKEKEKEEVKTAKIGEVAKVADVGFTVTSVEEKEVIKSGNEFIEDVKPSGKFIILKIKIDNGQKEALTINDTFFKIKTDDGATYEASTDSNVMMIFSDEKFFLEQINPGLSKEGTVVFDVPKDLDLSKAVLHCQTGAFGTESIEISLSQ